MEKNDLVTINNKDLLINFEDFLSEENNVDILFSAPFGSGKTFFFQNDFTPRYTNKYNVFHLFPVNYSISSNEDIMELIKYDILSECLTKHIDEIESAESLGFTAALQYQFYLSENFNFLNFSTSVLEKVSALTDDTNIAKSSSLLKLSNFLSQQYEKIKSKAKVETEDTIITTFIKSISEQNGSIYENNPYTKFIRSFLHKIKGEKKQNILIIDDLDRIDPEHIFRLFNVFSAQKNYISKTDKFGFDKVIFVCDISNIKSIYQHKYGDDVDFWGYISKFVSRRVFHFNNKNLIINQLKNILRNINYNYTLPNSVTLNENYIETERNRNLLVFLIRMLIHYEFLSLRDLVKLRSLEIEDSSRHLSTLEILYKYLDNILGNDGKFKSIIKTLSKRGEVFNYKTLNISDENDIIEEIRTLFNLIHYNQEMRDKKRGDVFFIQISNEVHIKLEVENRNECHIYISNGNIRNFNLISYLLGHI